MRATVIQIILITMFSCSAGNQENKIQQNGDTEQRKEAVRDIEKDNSNSEEISNEKINVICEISDSLQILFEKLNQLQSGHLIILDNILRIVESNEDDLSVSCSTITLKAWFVENATYSFFDLLKATNLENSDFNGFEYLFRLSVLYSNNAEVSQGIASRLAHLAKDTPEKFINYIDSLPSKEERDRALSYPFWNKEIYNSILDEINESIYSEEIIIYLKNSE